MSQPRTRTRTRIRTRRPPRDSLVLMVLRWIAASPVEHPLDITIGAAETAVTLALFGGDVREICEDECGGWAIEDDDDAAWIEGLAGDLRAHLDQLRQERRCDTPRTPPPAP